MRATLGPALVALVTAAVFLPALGNDFVNWDDPEMVIFNPSIRGLGLSQIGYAFTSTWFSHYHPLTWLSLEVDHAVWGLNPAGYHLTNLVLHALATACVFLVARALLRHARPDVGVAAEVGAGVAALVFSLHPLRVEPVAWAAARRDVLSGLFAFATLVAYVRACGEAPAVGSRRRGWLVVAVLLYLAALLSKAVVMALPLVLVVLDWYPLRRLQHRGVWVEKIPFAVLGAAGAVVAIWAATLDEFTAEGPAPRAAMAAYSFAFYVWKTAVPTGLAPIYEAPASVDPLAWPFVAGALTTAAITALAVALRSRAPALAVAWLAYVATILPVSGLAHAGHQLVYLRYSYLGGAAISILIGGVAASTVTAWRTRRLRAPFAAMAVVAVVVVLLGWSALTRREIRVWHDSETLWTRAVTLQPACALCLNNLGSHYVMNGRGADAEVAFRRALALRPSYDLAAWNLASVLRARGLARHEAGDYTAAVRVLAEAAALVPGNAELRERLARAQTAQRSQATSRRP